MTAPIFSDAITCAMPCCGNPTSLTESIYIDGCGQVCPDYAGPDPDWFNDIEPPY